MMTQTNFKKTKINHNDTTNSKYMNKIINIEE